MQGNIQILLRLVGREVLRGIETYTARREREGRENQSLLATGEFLERKRPRHIIRVRNAGT